MHHAHHDRTRIGTTVAAAALTCLATAGCADSDEPTAAAVVDDSPPASTTTASTTTASTTPESVTPGSVTPGPDTTTAADHSHDPAGDGSQAADLIAANLAAAAFQDVAVAEAAGYVSTIDALGCFENVAEGGMGLHFVNDALMDETLDVTRPEALVYELDANGQIVDLVAHEYIVPVEAWTGTDPPSLFGMDLHEHPTLPLFVLHTWIWKDNPAGVFADWNPKVRLCPDGIPVFGAAASVGRGTGSERPTNAV